MKIRHFAALSGIAIAMAASAAPVTPQEALTRASLDSRAPRAVRSAVTASPTLVKTMTSSSGAPAVYLFSTKADGFVMLPADDTCLPVLAYGYSHLTAATELPANVAWWLSEYSRQIEYAASRQQFTAVTASPAAAAADQQVLADCDALSAALADYSLNRQYATQLTSQLERDFRHRRSL